VLIVCDVLKTGDFGRFLERSGNKRSLAKKISKEIQWVMSPKISQMGWY
jgi:hypothetical protein